MSMAGLPPRQLLLGAALAATLATSVWLAGQPDGDAEAPSELAAALPRPRATPGYPAPTRTAEPGQPAATLPSRPPLPGAPPRAAAHWQLPAPPAAALAAPVRQAAASDPAPPPLRLRYLGQLRDGERRMAMLVSAQGRTLMLAVGEQIDGQWQVERITDTTLELRWLRGTALQRLRMGN